MSISLQGDLFKKKQKKREGQIESVERGGKKERGTRKGNDRFNIYFFVYSF